MIGLGIAGLTAGPPAHADGTSCVILPPEGATPAHVREAGRTMRAYQPETPGGWVERTRAIAEHRRLVREGSMREADVPDHARAISGEFWVPVLPTFFANTPAIPWAREDLDQQLFSSGASGSMRNYYDEVSYGHLEVRGNVYDWRGVPDNDTVYEGSNNGRGEQFEDFLEEAFESHDGQVDFGLFDNDGPDGLPNSGDDDGVADVVVLVHPEMGGECGGSNIWSHQYYYSAYDGGGWETNDARAGGGNIYIDRYLVSPGLSCGGGMIEIGIFCHELGHALGIKDLYDTDDTVAGDSFGLGDWALMARGNWNMPASPAHMSAFSKHRLGWLNYLNLTSGEDQLCIPPVETNPVAIRLWSYGAVTPEYFLVENRQRLGFDINLPGEGLVVYHVDEDRYDATAGTNTVNADETRKAIDLECADAMLAGNVVNADDLDSENNSGDSGDVFCASGGQSSFTPFTVPNTSANNGAPTSVAITNVQGCSPSGDRVCAEFSVGVATPVDVCINDCGGDDCNEIATCDDWWGSPDIYVDNDGDGDHDIPTWGIDNRLYTRVTNTGSDAAVATLGNVYLAWSALGLTWPDDATEQIGYVGFPVLDSGESEADYVDFRYPDLLDQNGHYCIGVVLQQTQDPPLSGATQYTNNIAQVNYQVLVDRGNGGEPARNGGGCGSVHFETWVRIYDGENPFGGSVACEIRVGTPPAYDDADIPAGWSYQIDPGTGPFFVSPVESDSVLVTIWSSSAQSGERAHLPLTLWNLDLNAPMGGLVIDAHADCLAASAPQNLSAQWIPPYGDDPDGPNVLVEWSPVTVDVVGGEEMLQLYEVYRAKDGGVFTLADRVVIDRDTATPGFQWTDRVAAGDCPASTWTYTVQAVDFAGNISDSSTPFTLECDDVTVGVDTQTTPVVSRLLAVEPNPLSRTTEVVFEMSRVGVADIAVYNARGQLVRRLLDEVRAAGTHRIGWDGRDESRQRAPSGVYFARVALPGGIVETRKMTVAR